MYDNHLAATGSGALVIGSVVLPWWLVALLLVSVGSGLVVTRVHAHRADGRG
ncbi:hypothetical protein [Streptomyces albipurpureus]|uniref:Uncharacterized protein n=1 Tax=Streptomyces albipurpureus TaxID=2897419 RepID=A0ABT0UEJ7_9ACTN|nr:hypothetical protein [Streptomyces sp. CWNU-1]MCM2386714.1 hypothetical protein [Streptomyces sp. CWNU-1]